jgi:hypothetical protein
MMEIPHAIGCKGLGHLNSSLGHFILLIKQKIGVKIMRGAEPRLGRGFPVDMADWTSNID